MNTETNPIFVTKASLPKLEEFLPYLGEIWANHQLTNNGVFHKKLETDLVEYLGVEHVSLYSNGTLALIAAIKVLGLSGEIITTPFSFVATSHAIKGCGLEPIFVDIEPQRLGIDPAAIRKAITARTSAIMPVHVYGFPCMMNEIEAIAKEHNLKVIYDAAHAFGVMKNRISILNRGDLSVLSFHATKLFSTIEGGAIVCNNREIKERLDQFRNFGIVSETDVLEIGINAKMNEMQAAFGLMQLQHVDEYISKRKAIVDIYRDNLSNVQGISFMEDIPNVKHNYNYFPIFIEADVYGIDRDALYNKLKQNNIFGRRYFYPLISNLLNYRELPSSEPSSLKVANDIADRVICLPLYPDLSFDDVDHICRIIQG